MRRGEVYSARLEPTEGSEQAGTRPVITVSRDAINDASPVVLAVPCTTCRAGRHVYVTQVLIHAPDGGLDSDSIVLGEQVRVLDKRRFGRLRGKPSPESIALLISFDVPGQR